MSARLRTSESKRTDGKGGVEGLRKRIMKLGAARTQIGVPGDARETESGQSLAVIAATHEFGSHAKGIPERSFLRAAILSNRKTYVSMAAKGIVKVADGGMTSAQVLGLLGQKASGDVKEYMRIGSFAPLAEATIRRKGSSKPLIDTGQLRQSITYRVVE